MIGGSRFGTGGRIGPAVRVFRGWVNAITLINSALLGTDGVVDARNRPLGGWAAFGQPRGGLTIVTKENNNSSDATLLGLGDAKHAHAMVLGQEGGSAARFALDGDGAMHYGDGIALSFDTTVKRHAANRSLWDPPVLAAGAWCNTTIRVAVARLGDPCSVGLATLTSQLVFLSARVVATGLVLVLARNEGQERVDLGSGILTVGVTLFD